MSDLSPRFDGAAASKPVKAAYPPPFSIRLTQEERAQLDVLRGNKSLSAYIREQLFGDAVAPRKRGRNNPVQDSEALGRVLGALGQSRLSSNLNQLAKAVNTGSLPVTPETESDLANACRDIAAMRADLLRALGKSPGDGP
ncbi:hypothetical protein [Nitratireductor aquibiodomus]|uniref:hypothetical protein n=1 Tax=Nitratireductor aquibiodomus TaxID=204799 RepID=UPI000468315B|nr:hypothetical protein [Nitratireductor aquibiodomus]